jgi:hypothetical protein
MNKEMTREIAAMVRDIIAVQYGGDEIGDWEALTNWWSEVSRDEDDCDFADHYSVKEVMEVIVNAMRQVYSDIERETNEALEQDRWETNYWNDRDYGGRL